MVGGPIAEAEKLSIIRGQFVSETKSRAAVTSHTSWQGDADEHILSTAPLDNVVQATFHGAFARGVLLPAQIRIGYELLSSSIWQSPFGIYILDRRVVEKLDLPRN